MAKYEVSVKKSAIKELENIPKKELQILVEKIQALSKEPRPRGSQKLSHKEQYRIRQGDYRAVYSIDDATLNVYIIKVGHRKEIYRL
ncbi:MAG: type II toxin-antitoxin system RelE/ParE family toxin [Candidatus Scalindua sp. AMX11]|nr:type II toxin-antitoxin system RelE/ParE family toxin [Planctomycetota bacterium]RZV60354.1 MAG: type II toxin-antitoxin system RelE/ParE family toxin [Candidatus Scalindua sp. SCAELEC01]TDE63096.1 MAG: type II toxin-antitoxin system RelE/ParE family toxin [Candidatus Scalindua sp. AMX11]